jgi:hypothetical protein
MTLLRRAIDIVGGIAGDTSLAPHSGRPSD